MRKLMRSLMERRRADRLVSTCERTVEHNHEVHAGKVIEAPRGSGGSSSVH
jgi:hypothetical protein